MKTERFWFKFNCTKYLADADTRALSLSAQGLLINLKAMMNEHGGRWVPTRSVEWLAAALSKTVAEARAALDELLAAGMLVYDEDVLTCPAMIENEDERKKAQLSGAEGWKQRMENAKNAPTIALAKGARTRPLKTPLKTPLKQEKSREEKSTAEQSGLTPAALLALYNANRGQLPEARPGGMKRARRVQAALTRHPDREFWLAAIQRGARSPVWQSMAEGDYRWGFDDLLDEDKLVKLLEGRYDTKWAAKGTTGPAPPATGPRTPSAEETRRRYLNPDKAANA